MKKSKNAESLAGIIIGVFILSIVVLGIADVLTYSTKLSSNYSDDHTVFTIKNNLQTIVSKLDTSDLAQGDVFFIKKTVGGDENTFEIVKQSECSGSGCPQRYINQLGVMIEDLADYPGDIYSHILYVVTEDTSIAENQNQIIRASVAKMQRK